MTLHGHKVLLGISGGIAAYKSAILARRLIDAGAEVRVVMTAGAQAFVTPLTLQALTGKPVHADLLDTEAEAAMGHIELARWADSVLVAPASANTLARLANGFADDLLSTLCLASDAPLHVAPAMNRLMWAHPAVRENVARLRSRGAVVLGPAEGVQACGETGAGRMLEPEALRDALIERVAARRASNGGAASASSGGTASASNDVADDRAGPLAGRTVVITAGPTQEAIDPVRFLGNRSSGRMGFAIADAAARRGARVTLVAGPVSLETPPGVERIDVVDARQMREAVLAAVSGSGSGSDASVDPRATDDARPADVFVGVAAVADYRVADAAPEKIKKSAERMTLELVRNPDILAEVAALPARPFCVGFAAETERVEAHARGKLERKRLDLIAANHVAQPGNAVFGSDTNALDVFWSPDGHVRVDTDRKEVVAERLLDVVGERLLAAEHLPATDVGGKGTRADGATDEASGDGTRGGTAIVGRPEDGPDRSSAVAGAGGS